MTPLVFASVQFGAHVAAETARWANAIEAADIADITVK